MKSQMSDGINYKLIKVFKPLKWQEDPWRDTSDIMLLTGSSGGGKSRLAAEKLHGFCLKYPESTALLLRKARAVISNSTLLFLKSEVIGRDPRVKHHQSHFRFQYENGSVLIYGGMKDAEQRERIRSIGLKGGVDIAWMEEATQFLESDFNEVLARMRGTAAPWTQIILSTNPDGPNHWINLRLIYNNEASVYYSRAQDNKKNPKSYIRMLEKLTGVEYQRLVLGKWAAGSGVVIDTWLDEFNTSTGKDFGGNVTNDAEYIPNGGIVTWSIDDGYSGKLDKSGMFTYNSHPRAFLMAQIRYDGTLAIFAEHFAVEMLAPEHIRLVISICKENGWPVPSNVIRDRAAASLEGALKEEDIRCRYNHMTVDESVKELRQWVAADSNGVRRVIVHPRCFHMRNEMATYSMDDEGRIVKQHDNGPDALRYLVWDQAFGVNPNVDIATWSGTVDQQKELEYA